MSTLRAAFVADGRHTRLDRVFEDGALRLRRPNAPTCEGLLINTAGGIVAGDRMTLDIDLGAESSVTMTNVAAEKIYRSAGATATIDTRLTLAAGSRLDWLPQETILFDGACLDRSLTVEMAAGASLVAAEMLVFGRLARGEVMRSGRLRDAWRVRRGGQLVFADATYLEGAIGDILDRPAVAGGARATALLLAVGPNAEPAQDPLRLALASFASDENETNVEAGASARDGILVARLVARSPERLRAAMVAALGVLRDAPLPRTWL